MPTASDLVTDLPADFEVFGQAVDTSLADLKGGTTGQVLSKTSGTDMDFTWVTTDDANAIQNSIVDAKGDLIAASANDTPARLAVGNNGETLVADSSATTGLRYQANFSAGKNKIINGDFGVWQRGTTFNSASSGTFFADRFTCYVAGGTQNITRQTFTPGTAPVAGYEGQFFLRWTSASAGSIALTQRIEDVRTFAGQTVTLSFWAKADSAITISTALYQYFGSGGSGTVVNSSGGQAITTSWARYSFTFNVASISGKTIGTGNYLQADINLPSSTFAFDTWGWQLEAGSVATAFQTATGTIQGELAACQRYFERMQSAGIDAVFGMGVAYLSNAPLVYIQCQTTKRVVPSISFAGTWELIGGNAITTLTSPNVGTNTTSLFSFQMGGTASGLTQGDALLLRAGTTDAQIDLSSEL